MPDDNHLVAAITGRFDIDNAFALPATSRIRLTTSFAFDEEKDVHAFGYGVMPSVDERVHISMALFGHNGTSVAPKLFFEKCERFPWADPDGDPALSSLLCDLQTKKRTRKMCLPLAHTMPSLWAVWKHATRQRDRSF